jgi:endonuclease YncB( thermonuclease family)
MILFFILALLVAPAKAENFFYEENISDLHNMYVYKAIRIIDGDTIALNVENEKPLIQKLGLSVRIRGIDAPERGSRAKCDKEKALAEKATKLVNDIVGAMGQNELLLSKVKWDAYGGRVDAFVKVNGVDIGKALLVRGLAVENNGEKKTKDWCK